MKYKNCLRIFVHLLIKKEDVELFIKRGDEEDFKKWIGFLSKQEIDGLVKKFS